MKIDLKLGWLWHYNQLQQKLLINKTPTYNGTLSLALSFAPLTIQLSSVITTPLSDITTFSTVNSNRLMKHLAMNI